jgi:hypothetical protein
VSPLRFCPIYALLQALPQNENEIVTQIFCAYNHPTDHSFKSCQTASTNATAFDTLEVALWYYVPFAVLRTYGVSHSTRQHKTAAGRRKKKLSRQHGRLMTFWTISKRGKQTIMTHELRVMNSAQGATSRRLFPCAAGVFFGSEAVKGRRTALIMPWDSPPRSNGINNALDRIHHGRNGIKTSRS